MSKIDIGTIEKFQIALQKDPNSQVFATLAEAYREMQMLKEAETVVRNGMRRHPNFVGGLVTFAKIMRDVGNLAEALPPLKKAVQLAPENILAHQLMAEIYLANKQPKDSLKSFKMVLFLNPNSKNAQNAVSKLESLTADDYDDEVFEMTKLQNVQMSRIAQAATAKDEPAVAAKSAVDPHSPRALERMLSLIDAFIVRNDLEKAHLLLKDTIIEFGEHPEIQRRMKSLQIRTNHDPDPAPLRPLNSTGINRERMLRERNLRTLNQVLQNIDSYREMTSRV